MVKVRDEVKARRGDGQHNAIVRVVVGEHVRDRVERAGLVLDGEVEPMQLPDPMVPWNHGEALVEEELQAVVVGADAEAAALKIRPPVSYSLNETDQLTLVGRQLVVAGGKWPAKEGQGPSPLV